MPSSLVAIIPILCVTAAAIAAMLAEALRDRGERVPIAGLGVIGLAGALVTSVLLWGRDASSFGVVVADRFGLFVGLVLIGIGLLTVLFAPEVVRRDRLPSGEFYALVLFGVAGMMLMAMGTDLLVIFLGLEVLSLSVYVLTAIDRQSEPGAEGAYKYFVLGGFATAFIIYGIAYVYGLTGSTRLDVVGEVVRAHGPRGSVLALLATGLLLVGFAFKVSAVPFHMWTPDAYQGAPTLVSGFMSTGVKAAALAAFARIFLTTFAPMRADWMPILWWIAVATMVVGTVVGVAQTNMKRMLAYSSIAHGGYLLVGIIAGTELGQSALLFYLAAYAVTNVAAFAVIAVLGTRQEGNDELADYAGLARRRPLMAAALTVCLLSLGGLPPTAGFVAKWAIFTAAVGTGDFTIAVVGVLTSVVAVFFYLRIVVMMYMSEPAREVTYGATSRATAAGLVVSIAIIVYLGVLPGRLLDLAASAVGAMF